MAAVLTSTRDMPTSLSSDDAREGKGARGGPSAPSTTGGWAWGPRALGGHSHSMVPGGLLVTSRTTRLTSGTSFVMRVEIVASTSYGRRVQSAVIASSDETGRSTTGWPYVRPSPW